MSTIGDDSGRTLVWFRSDLRVDDNPALAAACAGEAEVRAIFVACPKQWRRKHDWGDPKIDFVARSVAALRGELARLGIPLAIRCCDGFEEAAEVVLAEARQHLCSAVVYNRELEVNEVARDQQLGVAAEEAGIDVRAYDDQAIVRPGSLKTGQGKPYSVFTPFWRSWLRHVEEHGAALCDAPGQRGSSLDPQGMADDWCWDGAAFREDLWPAGEQAARQRLDRFVGGVADSYVARRDVPATAGTSSLSPYLALGVLSPRTALAVAVAGNGGEIEGGRKGLAAWIRQLAWRDFYRHVLVGFPRVSRGRAFRIDYEALTWRSSPDDLAAWQEGRTGVPIVDAGMRQLNQTGWMHNRLRMVTAMFLAKHLLLDWRLGERYFMRRLVDADLANNNGGWQWSASVGTDAAPYFRIFNPWRQGARFDAEGRYIKRLVPELEQVRAKDLHDEKGAALAARLKSGYPEPIVDHKSARQRALDLFRDLG